MAWRRTDAQTTPHMLTVILGKGRDLIVLSPYFSYARRQLGLRPLLQCPQAPTLHPSLPVTDPNHAREEAGMTVHLLLVEMNRVVMAPHLALRRYLFPLMYQSEL